ncbi:MAG: sulfate transporter, periplasmic sulfate-binding protein [Thermomicrobiales bacterium]|nr:sulfate transporter, periplasmic sulfate-binding protein [Thermomicrobiales bacterium]MCD6033494.1 sulfate transporter, periplasmic sulfate-binding protein [Thermomicrobiales bacterium]
MPSHDRLLQSRFTRRQALLTLAATAAAPALASSFPRPALAQDQVTLTLVAYSTPREAYEEILPLFQATPEGTGVQFETSFAASGEQSRAVESGLPADIIALSLEPDITRLIEPGLVAEDWNADEYKGMVTDSVVVLAVRPGNPKGIATWDDLLKEGVEVITPNPLTSGGARWNIMAAYGAQLAQGKSEEEAAEYLRQLFTHVPVLDKSARESLATFAGGKGDVLIAYENEAITAQQKDEPLEYVVPDQTILIENPVAVVTESANPEKAQAFIDFLRTSEAQRIFGEKGYRPIVPEVLTEFDYPTPANLFTIADHGGWAEVTSTFFDPDNGLVAQIVQQ